MKEKIKAFADSRARNKNQTQGFFYIVIGGYLCYIAVSLIKTFFEEQPSMPLWAAILFSVFFILFGLAVMGLGGYTVWYNYKQTDSPVQDSEAVLPDAGDAADDAECSDGSGPDESSSDSDKEPTPANGFSILEEGAQDRGSN